MTNTAGNSILAVFLRLLHYFFRQAFAEMITIDGEGDCPGEYSRLFPLSGSPGEQSPVIPPAGVFYAQKEAGFEKCSKFPCGEPAFVEAPGLVMFQKCSDAPVVVPGSIDAVHNSCVALIQKTSVHLGNDICVGVRVQPGEFTAQPALLFHPVI